MNVALGVTAFAMALVVASREDRLSRVTGCVAAALALASIVLALT